MRFAYLIMAHDNPGQLEILIKLLDYEGNDIFLHIDKKNEDINISRIENIVTRATIHIYKKYDVRRAEISQTVCQTFLLEEAVKTEHDYYHLLSGHDLPIKSNEEIRAFFKSNQGKEFIHFESDDYSNKLGGRYYNFGRGFFPRLLLIIQIKLHVNRRLYCGANWYSITQPLALELVKNKKKMLRMVRRTISSDEYILQTFYRKVAKGKYVLYKHTDNPFDYSASARLIDWHRGEPYVWHNEDYEELIGCDRFFARKFDENVDFEIIQKLVKRLSD